MRFIIAITSLAFLLGCFGCSSHSANAPLTLQPAEVQLKPLKRDEYVVLGGTSAESCARFIGLFPLPIWFVSAEHDPGDRNSQVDFWLWGFRTQGRARDLATYKAIGRAWRADSMMAPREHIEELSVYPWYKRSCVTVRGKAIRIIPDKKGSMRSSFVDDDD